MTSSLFSHAPEPEPEKQREPVADVEDGCTVPRETDEAFRGFHEYPHLWWPQEFTSFGDGTHLEFEGGALVETSLDEETATGGTVLDIRPGELLELEWVPVDGAAGSTTVQVTFTEIKGGTVVRVRHTGFSDTPDGAEQRKDAEVLWRNVLQRYARFMGAG